MLPTFLVIGARKAGTTSLFHYLRAHPDVFMPEQKRLEFFSGDNWDRGVAWYESQFDRAGDASARGEASSSYTRHPLVRGVPERVAEVVPDVRLVYLVRHPIDRMLSQYRQLVAERDERRPFAEALAADPSEYVAPSRYSTQLERYLEVFPPDRMLVVRSEDLRDRRDATLGRVLSFLGVDPGRRPSDGDREFHRGDQLRRAGRLAGAVRSSRVWRAARRAVPARVREAAWKAGSRPVHVDPAALDVPDELRADLVERLRPDLERLRDRYGAEYAWGLLDGR
jgi:hypothetical protein